MAEVVIMQLPSLRFLSNWSAYASLGQQPKIPCRDPDVANIIGTEMVIERMVTGTNSVTFVKGGELPSALIILQSAHFRPLLNPQGTYSPNTQISDALQKSIASSMPWIFPGTIWEAMVCQIWLVEPGHWDCWRPKFRLFWLSLEGYGSYWQLVRVWKPRLILALAAVKRSTH